MLGICLGCLPKSASIMTCGKPPRQANPRPPASPVIPPETLSISRCGSHLAGLRCGLGHALAPDICLASDRLGQLVPSTFPPQPARPEARKSRPRTPAQISSPQGPRQRESGQFLLRLRCSFLRLWACAELSALMSPPTFMGLQRGRAQLSAEGGCWGAFNRTLTRLQRGRAQLSAEGLPPPDGLRDLLTASTGPRSIERGRFMGRQSC